MRVSGPVIQHNYGRTIQNGFGGLNHNLGATDGEIFDMMNMCGDFYPLLATREMSWKKAQKPRGMLGIISYALIEGREIWVCKSQGDFDVLWIGDEDGYIESQNLTDITGVERTITEISGKICIFPDKFYYNTAVEKAHRYTSLEAVFDSEKIEGNYIYVGAEGSPKELYRYWIDMWRRTHGIRRMNEYFAGRFTIEDGTYAGQPAERNTIKIAKTDLTNLFFPEIGDALTVYLGTNSYKTAIVREMETDTDYVYLRFYEGTFPANGVNTGTIEKKVPDLDFICEHKNRLWGCKGKEIFCSHLGNPLNWYEYESLADGAWAVEIGSGELTGCVSYNYPLFFTENEIYTILGNEPAEYALSVTPNTFGLAKGSHRSFAIVREYLFYHSPYGFCYYYGSMPQLCSAALGTEYFRNAVGGGKGGKYYVSCETENGLTRNYVFDATRGMWHKEQNAFTSKIAAFAWDGDLYSVMGDGVYSMGLPRNKPSDDSEFGDDPMPSQVVFAPWDTDSVNKKQVKSICIRHEVEGTLTAHLYVDGVENASLRKVITGNGMTEIVGIPRRGDKWQLVLDGAGAWKVYSIAYDFYEGSAKK